MELIVLLVLMTSLGLYMFNARDQRRRIALLASHLGKYQIEKLMEGLTEGYMRALSEQDPERRTQIWNLQSPSEQALCEQLGRFVAGLATLDADQLRVSKLPWSLPYAWKLFPGSTFDLRQALAIHAAGVSRSAKSGMDRSPRKRAFTLSAELFLLQHTCHWYCRSRTVASARMLVRHRTSHAQLLDAVAPETRQAYLELAGP